MKLIALYNPDGVILAAVEDTGRYNAPTPVPVASGANKVGTFDVPELAARLRLDEICKSHRVDIGAKRLIESKSSR
jgi:hypothetical protein